MKNELYVDRLSRLYGGDLTKDVTIQVTEDCNLACKYCYQINKSKRRLNFTYARKFIDMILSNEKSMSKYLNNEKTNGYVFNFIGGEPFLEVELMDKICEYIIKKMANINHELLPFIRFSISTNGTLYFTEKVQRYLKKYKDFISLCISLDGNKELHDSQRVYPNGMGTFNDALFAVKDWKQKGNFVGSKLTISPNNVKFLSNAVIFMINNGYEIINMNCVYEEGWKLNDATTLYFELKRIADYIFKYKLQTNISMFNEDIGHSLSCDYQENWCGGNGRMIALGVDGKIYPCIRYMASSLGEKVKPLIIGDVKKGMLKTKEQCETNKCLKCITRESQSTRECFNCPVASGCAWCTAYNYQITGDPNKRMTYICDMHKATSLANVYYWNKRGVYFPLCLLEADARKIIPENEYELLMQLAKDK